MDNRSGSGLLGAFLCWCLLGTLQAVARSAGPFDVPGRIEAEDYGSDGAGISYHDATAGNSGGAYRTDDVDIQQTSDTGGGYNVGWIADGEWLAYEVEIQETAVYSVVFRVASVNGAASIHVSLDGIPLCGIPLPSTGGYQNWVDVAVSNVVLQAGVGSLRLEFKSGAFNLNRFDITKQGDVTGGYLRASGKRIVNGAGENVLLRGIGLGNWMLQEPYMLDLSGVVATQTELKQKIADLAGTGSMNAFYDAWLTNYMTEQDVEAIAQAGFNSIRLPMHYNLFTLPVDQEPVPGENSWLVTGFDLLDTLLDWCASNHIYLILDMHAAPGGQGYDRAIADYNPPAPSLWESTANREKLVALWHEIAARYATNDWIGAYDLINEPNWTFEGSGDIHGGSDQSNAPLRQLLVDITAAIREVDTNHLIVIEGNGWGNNYNGIFPPWDANMAVSFHKYWNEATLPSYQWVVDHRDAWNIPVWMGESGENSNEWFRDAVRYAEAWNIGWSWWPWKKQGSIAGPVLFDKPAGYQEIVDYWRNGGAKPSASTAFAAFMELADRTRLEHCSIHRDVIDALIRPYPQGETLPFTAHSAPGMIQASDYDLGRQDEAYFDLSSGNNGNACRNDAVDIESVSDSLPGNGFDVGWIDAGEWLKYTVPTRVPGTYRVYARVAGGNAGGGFYLECNGTNATGTVAVPDTGGWQNWTTADAGTLSLRSTNDLRFVAVSSGFNLQWFALVPGPESTNALPSGWNNRDVGSVGLAGGAVYDAANSVWAACGSGGTSDQFNFTFRNYAGDGIFIARVASAMETGPAPREGIMFRESADADSRYAFVYIGADSIGFETRDNKGSTAMNVGSCAGGTPYWLMLVRSGDTFSAYCSPDGETWTLLGSHETAMPTDAMAGLAVTAGNNAAFNTARFDHVSLAAAPRLRLTEAVSGQTRLSWPGWAAGFRLHTTTNLLQSAIWSEVTNTPAVQANAFTVTVSLPAHSRFFKLFQP